MAAVSQVFTGAVISKSFFTPLPQAIQGMYMSSGDVAAVGPVVTAVISGDDEDAFIGDAGVANGLEDDAERGVHVGERFDLLGRTPAVNVADVSPGR